jgi:HAD superfamily hydrolase (TIGR01509 family)
LLHGVLFDVDGTLLDSNDAHASSWVDTFAEAGYDVPFDVVRPLIGMGGDKLLPKAAKIEADSAEGKKLTKRRSEIFLQKYLPHLYPFPGARALVQRVRDEGLKVVVATSAKDRELTSLLKAATIDDLIQARATSSDAANSKPDPDIVKAAIRDSGFPAAELVMIGDTPYDVEAGSNAGVRVIGFRSGGWSDADLRGAAEIYAGPADLLAHYGSSLLGSHAN